jgi:hypothetical protein
MRYAYNSNSQITASSGGAYKPDLARPRSGSNDGLLISPISGQDSQDMGPLGPTLFWLGIGLILSGFILIIALISLILF